MQAVNAITIKNDSFEHNRIGPANKDRKNFDFLCKIENFLTLNSPLPITYDVKPIHPAYFAEFTYHDALNGFQIKSMSAELNARLYQKIYEDTQNDGFNTNFYDQLKNNLRDKYVLNSFSNSTNKYKKIIFLSGGNLFPELDWNYIDSIMAEDEDFYVKFHPITKPDDMKNVARRYGWNRLIDLNVSGIQLLQNCEEMISPCSSEMLITGILYGKNVNNCTNVKNIGATHWFTLYRLFNQFDNNEEKQKIITQVVNDKRSGFIFSFQDDWKERLQAYFDEIMVMRSFFKPLVPFYPDKFP